MIFYKNRFRLFVLFGIFCFVAFNLWFTKQYSSPPDVIRQPLPYSIIYKDYCILSNVIVSEHTNYERITLVLHASAHYLDEQFVSQMETWNAPISLSVYLYEPSVEYSRTLNELSSLISANKILRENLRVHFFYKKENGDCSIPLLHTGHQEIVTSDKNLTAKAHKSSKYPSNVARNIARMFSLTKFMLIGDYDHYYSLDFEKKVREIAEVELEKDPKQLLITRRFEVDDTVKSLPQTKEDLNQLLSSKQAFTFHEFYWKIGHSIVGLPEWLNEKERGINGDGISKRNISHGVRSWEPIFVSLTSISQWHDENIPYPTDDNVSLRLELCRAGYRFSVLSDHFIFHKGIKSASSESKKISDIVIGLVRTRHRNAINMFKHRLNRLFPETIGKCPKI